MLRFIAPIAAIVLVLPFTAQAASLKDQNLNRMLQRVAQESNQNLPREINDNLLEQAYTVQGKELIDNISVQPEYAAKMRENAKMVYLQTGATVCRDPNFRKLMAEGAVMRYEFTENKTNRPVASLRYVEADCPKAAPAKKK